MRRLGNCIGRLWADPLVEHFTSLVDQACGCADMACAEKLNDPLTGLLKHKDSLRKIDQAALMKSSARMEDCLEKLAAKPTP